MFLYIAIRMLCWSNLHVGESTSPQPDKELAVKICALRRNDCLGMETSLEANAAFAQGGVRNPRRPQSPVSRPTGTATAAREPPLKGLLTPF